MKLSRDVFVALSSIAWADGVVKPSEAEAIVRAARACGVAGKDLEAVERSVAEKTPIDGIARLSLQWDERLFVYAMGKWLMGVDGVVVPAEKIAVEKLGEALQMSPEDRLLASRASIAASVFTVDGRHDLHSLAREIEDATVDGETTIHVPPRK